MQFARISRQEKPITSEEWSKVIDGHPSLKPMPDRDATHPISHEKILIPGLDKALCEIGGELVGNAVLEAGEVLTTGLPLEVNNEIAKLLQATVQEDDTS